MARLEDVVKVEASSKRVVGDKFWLLNLDMVEQQTGNIIGYNYVGKDVLNGSIIQFDTGCVLYSKLRPNLNKVVIPSQDGFATSEMLPLRPNTKMLTREYLTAFLRSDSFVTWAVSKTAGAKMPRLGSKELLGKEIPLPSISEQTRIAGQFAKVDELIALRKEQLAKLDQLVKSRFIELFGDYRINEKGFDCKKGSELFKFSSGKFLPEEKRLDNGIPVYGGNGIAWYTNECLIDYPTIIIGRVGAQCGNIHAVTTPVWITDNAIYIKEQKTKAYTLEFLTELMRMMDFYQYADFSGQPKITQKPLETLEYIMPPIELQNEYTAFVEQTDKSKFAIQQSLDKLELLKKALMQQYFG